MFTVFRPCSACERATLRGHSGTVYSAQFIHDTQYIISGSEDTSGYLYLQIYDLKLFSQRTVQINFNLSFYKSKNANPYQSPL